MSIIRKTIFSISLAGLVVGLCASAFFSCDAMRATSSKEESSDRLIAHNNATVSISSFRFLNDQLRKHSGTGLGWGLN